jgi:hypothetical protein
MADQNENLKRLFYCFQFLLKKYVCRNRRAKENEDDDQTGAEHDEEGE